MALLTGGEDGLLGTDGPRLNGIIQAKSQCLLHMCIMVSEIIGNRTCNSPHVE